MDYSIVVNVDETNTQGVYSMPVVTYIATSEIADTYSISKSSTSDIAASGISSVTYDAGAGTVSFSYDKSVPKTYLLYVKAAITTHNEYAYSNLVSISVVCSQNEVFIDPVGQNLVHGYSINSVTSP